MQSITEEIKIWTWGMYTSMTCSAVTLIVTEAGKYIDSERHRHTDTILKLPIPYSEAQDSMTISHSKKACSNSKARFF